MKLPDDIGISLSWQPPLPSNAVLNGYRIFKDDVQIVDLDTTYTGYTDLYVIPGHNYSYYIKSFYITPFGHSPATDTLSVLVTGNPVVPILTSAEIVDTNSVHLEWMLPLQDRGVIGYHIYRNGALVLTIDDVSIQEWTDPDLPYGLYSYQVASKYPSVNSDLSDSITVEIIEPVGNSDQILAPLVFGVDKIYPNPFNRKTQIQYCVDKDNVPLEICIYNLKGQKVRTLLSGTHKKGNFQLEWNGTASTGQSVSAGIYLVKLQSGSLISVQRVLLIK